MDAPNLPVHLGSRPVQINFLFAHSGPSRGFGHPLVLWIAVDHHYTVQRVELTPLDGVRHIPNTLSYPGTMGRKEGG